MDVGLSSLSLFKALKHRIDWFGQRQVVLAQNVANANTPDYLSKDVTSVSFEDVMRNRLQTTPVVRTNPQHLSGTVEKIDYRVKKERIPFETSPDGNNVVLEEQLLKLGKTETSHKLTSNLYRKHMSMIITALGK